MSSRREYVVATAARDEAENLPRLAAALIAQTITPSVWFVVDNGSTDGTRDVARALSAQHRWIRLLLVPGEVAPVRGRPIVRALHAAIAHVESQPDIFVNIDADVSMEPDYFERLLAEFDAEPTLGIASGSAWEEAGGVWKQRFVTGSTVWGALRAYRWACLDDVLPLEERLGWDGIDEIKANARGWRTRTFLQLPFRHHRPEGVRDGRFSSRVEQGRVAHFMGYRPWYLSLRALHHVLRGEPAALGLCWGYLRTALRREPRCDDLEARQYLRTQQRLSRLPARRREALGRSRAVS